MSLACVVVRSDRFRVALLGSARALIDGLAAAAVAAWMFSAPAGAAPLPSNIVPGKVLFDATKAEMAGNADWVIDADTHNVGTGSSGAMVPGSGTDSNPQRFPNPAQSGITASTPETYWSGAISSWAVALVKRGFSVETLPIGGHITYGDATNAQDLSNYGIFVIDEPNIMLTAAEKAALVHFVQAGGGLFIVGDHNASDRNNDGNDSVDAINDLMSNNGVATNPFGILLNYATISTTTSAVATSSTDPLIHGAAGAVSQMQYSSGTSLTISGAAHGAIWQTAARASNAVFVAYSTYGAGKVVVCGDSSPFDDGTGDSNDTLYNGWTAEVNGDHGRLAINACLWLNPPAQQAPCPGDIDGNRVVDASDLAQVLVRWGACAGCASDLDGDGAVAGSDLAILLAHWGACP